MLFFSRASGSLIYISQESPVKELSHEIGGKCTVTDTEPYVDRSTYNGVWPGSPRGSFMTLSLPQCHAVFRTIPSTLAWVDQSPVSQYVLL